jgi:hypothetical protein
MDPREELAALRRLAELEAKAKGGTPQAQTARVPQRKGVVDNINGALATLNRNLIVGDEMAAAGGMVTRTARDAMAGKAGRNALEFLQNAGRNYGAALDQQNAMEDAFAAENPYGAAVARTVGQGASMLVPAGAALNATRGLNMARGAVSAALPAAGMALMDRGTIQERLSNANKAAAISGLFGGTMGAFQQALPKVPKEVKVSPEVALLAREGVQLTPGQMRGGVRRAAEEAGGSLPLVGEAIASRRREGIETFNRAVVNRALKPLGETLPERVSTGSDAVKYAGDLISKGYDEALPSALIADDPQFAQDVTDAFGNLNTLTPENYQRAQSIINDRLFGRLPKGGKIDGETYKKIQSGLDFEVRRFGRSTDPDQNAMSDAIQSVQTALEKSARRQDPEFASKIDALDRGWAELSRLETAAAKSTDMSGVFTPAQYRQAISAGESRVRNRGVARGEAMSQDLASAALKVLPQQMPNSGTADRALWALLAQSPISAGAAGMVGGPLAGLAAAGGTAATVGGLAAGRAAYSPKAIQAANTALQAGLPGPARQAALAELEALAAKDQNLRGLYSQVLARLGAISAQVPAQ